MTNGPDVYLFIHVEERSMEARLDALLPKMALPPTVRARVINHGSKSALLRDIETRLRGYARRTHEDIRVLVLVDRDSDNCVRLKSLLEEKAASAGFATKSRPGWNGRFRVVNRIVVEELESWFLGDAEALCAAYNRVRPSYATQARFRDPDGVAGGTCKALHALLKRSGHLADVPYLPKTLVAEAVAPHISVNRNRSRSFQHFVTGLRALIGQTA